MNLLKSSCQFDICLWMFHSLLGEWVTNARPDVASEWQTCVTRQHPQDAGQRDWSSLSAH